MADAEKTKIAKTIRDSIHNLVIVEKNETENEYYYQKLKELIQLLEGCRYEAYYDGITDPKNSNQFISMADFYDLPSWKRDKLEGACKKKKKTPIVTVGIGANINASDDRRHYDKVLGHPGLMQRVYEGRLYGSRAPLVVLENIWPTCWPEPDVNLYCPLAERPNSTGSNNSVCVSKNHNRL